MKIGQYLANIWTRDEWLLFFWDTVYILCLLATTVGQGRFVFHHYS